MDNDTQLIHGRAGVSSHEYLPFHLRLSLSLMTTLRLANPELPPVYLILGSQHLWRAYYTLIYLHLLPVIITTILFVLCYCLHFNNEKLMNLGDEVSCLMPPWYVVDPVFESRSSLLNHLFSPPLQCLIKNCNVSF